MQSKVSKTLSYWLRHHPGDAGLEPDEQGFVELEAVLGALRERFSGREFNQAWVDQQLSGTGNKRFERRGNQLRARYGHSIEVELDYPELQRPGELYHGTSPKAWQSIKTEGLRPQGRQYVHLTEDRDEALRVGFRHADDPVMLLVEPPEDAEQSFYRAGAMILTERVPPDWISRIEPNR